MSEIEQSKREEEASNSRRDFLKKAGKLAMYTPPAMLALMKPSYACIAKSHNPTQCDD